MLDYYDSNAPHLAATYESLEAARLNAWFQDVLPVAPACVLDIGAGSGRDAAWLASLGYEVVAVEPSAAMVREAQRIHPESVIHWVEGGESSDQTIYDCCWKDDVMLVEIRYSGSGRCARLKSRLGKKLSHIARGIHETC